MKKSVELPVRPAQEKKPTIPPSQRPVPEKNKPYREPVEKEQKKTIPTHTRGPEAEGDEYEETVHPDTHKDEHKPEEKPW